VATIILISGWTSLKPAECLLVVQPLFPDLEDLCEDGRKTFLALKEAGLEANHLFDVGSAFGSWSCTMSQIFLGATFYLFEPLVDARSLYADGTARTLNALAGSRFFKVALSDHNGSGVIRTDPSGLGASLLVKSLSDIFPEEVGVSMRRLDDLMAEQGLPAPDVLKMDVQGGEMLVLRGFEKHLTSVKAIQAETWFKRGYGPDTPLLHELYQFLAPYGFVLLDIGERFYTPVHELSSCDAFFVQRTVLEGLKTSLPRAALT
jgi:FkbM family methyltransferase